MPKRPQPLARLSKKPDADQRPRAGAGNIPAECSIFLLTAPPRSFDAILTNPRPRPDTPTVTADARRCGIRIWPFTPRAEDSWRPSRMISVCDYLRSWNTRRIKTCRSGICASARVVPPTGLSMAESVWLGKRQLPDPGGNVLSYRFQNGDCCAGTLLCGRKPTVALVIGLDNIIPRHVDSCMSRTKSQAQRVKEACS